MHWLLSLVAKLPLGFLQGFGACIGELVFWLSPGYRRRTRDNLRHAGYNEAKFFTKVGRNAGRQSMESIWVWYRPAKDSAFQSKKSLLRLSTSLAAQ